MIPEALEQGLRLRWVIFATLVIAAACRSGDSNQAPDVLVVTLDTTRRDALGCYGAEGATPQLQELAEDGFVFDELFSVGYGTSPSHASLFLSSHPSLHGVYDNATVLPARRFTLAEVLARAGWQTGAFVSAVPVGSHLGFARGFEHFDERFGAGHFQRSAGATVDAALQWLAKSDSKEPFFAWIHLYDPHQPYDPPIRWREPMDEEVSDFFLDNDGRPLLLRPQELPPEVMKRVDSEARRRYRGEVAYVDDQLGRFLNALRERGSYRRTLVLAVADHGECFLADGAGYAFDHGGLRGSVSRLAGIFKLPNNEAAGSRSGALLGNHDLAPTILDALGLPRPSEWTGRSVLPVLRSKAPAFHSMVVIEGAERSLISVRTPDWAYMEPWGSGHPEWGVDPETDYTLYDIRADPEESINVWEEHPDTVARMHDVVESFLVVAASGPRESVEDPDQTEALRALGYLD